MEKHHQVQILDEALEAAVKLSHRYIPARQLPDKSVSLLDTERCIGAICCCAMSRNPALGCCSGPALACAAATSSG